jgi:hypothetical protein
MPVAVVHPSTRQIVRIGEVDADSDLLAIRDGSDGSAQQRIVAQDRRDLDPSSITLAWWLDEDDSLCVKASLGNTAASELKKYKLRRHRESAPCYSNEGRLLHMLLEAGKKGLRFRDALEGVFLNEPELQTESQFHLRTQITRLRSTIREIKNRFANAEINPAVIPKCWGIETTAEPIALMAESIIDVHRRDAERVDCRLVELFEVEDKIDDDSD